MTIRIDRIITKTGDEGRSYSSCGMLEKYHPWFKLIGGLDKLGAALGIAGHTCACEQSLLLVQNTLFDIGADLYTNNQYDLERANYQTDQSEIGSTNQISYREIVCNKFKPEQILYLEQIVRDNPIPSLESFVLATGPAATLHFARALCRELECEFWRQQVNKDICKYLNRLSDALFALAINCDTRQKLWVPSAKE